MNVGGPAFHVANLAASLGPPFETTLVTGAPGDGERDMVAFARDMGVDVRVIPELGPAIHPGSDAKAFLALRRLFRRESPQIVHTHTAKAGALGRAAATAARVPVRIHTFHGHVLGGNYFTPGVTATYRWIEQQLARVTSRIVVLAEAQRQELSDRFGVAPPSAFRVIPLGLDLDRFRDVGYPRRKARTRVELGIPANCSVVAAVGRLVWIKRHDLLLEALSLLSHSEKRDWRLVIVGGGDRESELRRLAVELGVDSRVTWLGWREDVPRVLEACDVVAQTSDDEGTPVSVIEAVALGIPVVATDVGGVKEILGGVPGTWLVSPGDPEAVAEALARALEEEEAIPEEARDRFVKRFAVSRLAKDVADLYRGELRRAGIECESQQPRL